MTANLQSLAPYKGLPRAVNDRGYGIDLGSASACMGTWGRVGVFAGCRGRCGNVAFAKVSCSGHRGPERMSRGWTMTDRPLPAARFVFRSLADSAAAALEIGRASC